MKRSALAFLMIAAASGLSATNDITITPIQHAGVQIEYAGKVIQVDPAQGDPAKAKPGDLVLVTDIHGDHLNPDMLANKRYPLGVWSYDYTLN